jgi:hypothetical protein
MVGIQGDTRIHHDVNPVKHTVVAGSYVTSCAPDLKSMLRNVMKVHSRLILE